MTVEENVAIVHRYWEQCWNLHDPDDLSQTHHPTFAQNGVPLGIPAFKDDLSAFFRSFPDVRVSIEDVLAVGDRVLMRVTYQGTHREPYQGYPATKRAIRVSGLELFLVLGGRIVQHWHEMDHLGLLRQIDVAPVAQSQSA